jgi:hypothetical protein
VKRKTHTLPPYPVSRHHVAILAPLVVKFLIWGVVDVALEVWSCEKILDDVARVPIPNFVPRGLPLGRASCFGGRTVVFQADALPADVAHLDCVDLTKEIPVVVNGGRAAMGDKCCSPKLEELVDLSPRKLGVCKHELCQFKPGSRREGRPVVVCLDGRSFWWNIWQDEIPMLITAQPCEE